MSGAFSRVIRVLAEPGSGDAAAEEASLVIRAPPILPRPLHQPLALAGEITVAVYRHAVDRRNVSVVRCVSSEGKQIGAVLLEGRHVGTLGTVVPTGRAFSCLAHICSQDDEVVIESSFLANLIGIDVHSLSPDASGFRTIKAATRSDLLAGEPEATYWARAWNLSPYLARVGVLLIAGCSVSTIAKALRITSKTARTYIERVLRNAGMGSVAALPLAALEQGRDPPRQDRLSRPRRARKVFAPEQDESSEQLSDRAVSSSRSSVRPSSSLEAPGEREP